MYAPAIDLANVVASELAPLKLIINPKINIIIPAKMHIIKNIKPQIKIGPIAGLI